MPIKIDNLCFSYNSEMIIDGLNLKVNDNEILAIVGNTGSGKSTLVQLIAGLLKADKGKIIVDNDDIIAKKFNKKILRKKLGIVFQFPEMQLFEQSVEKDIFFGLKQYNLSYKEKCARAKEVLNLLGLDNHHKSVHASKISNGLMSEDDLEKIFVMAGITDIYKKSTDDIYIVSGKKA